VTSSGPRPATALEQGPKPTATGSSGVVSASHPLVVEAMADALRAGGSAADAVTTGVLLQTVVEPQMTSLAGGVGILSHDARTGAYTYLDGELAHTRSGAPVARTWREYDVVQAALGDGDGRRIAVPGLVRALAEHHRRHGRLSWARCLAPAEEVARDGFAMYSFLYGETYLAQERLARYASGRAEFLPDGHVPPVGTRVRRPALAETLHALATDGPDHMAQGAWASAFVEAARSTGADLGIDELRDHGPVDAEPLTFRAFGATVRSAPLPATGGALVALVLRVAERCGVDLLRDFRTDAAALARLRAVVGLAEHVSDLVAANAGGSTEALAAVLDDGAAAVLGDLARAVGVRRGPEQPTTPGPAAPATTRASASSVNTSHLVAVDAEGSSVSVTHSVCGTTFGTGLVVGGVNVNSGNGFPGEVGVRGGRVVSPFPPTMVSRTDAAPDIVTGSPGLAARAVAHVLLGRLGFGLSMTEAIDAPRFQGSGLDDTLHVEARVEPTVLDELTRTWRVPVSAVAPYHWHFGDVHTLERGEHGVTGHADPRRPGSVVALDAPGPRLEPRTVRPTEGAP